MNREFKSLEFKESAVNMSQRTIEGYAATFELDQVDDIINPGAFTKTIDEGFKSGRIKMLWQHDSPLGMPLEMAEDSKGLYVKGRVSRTALGDDALELMRDGVVDRMSIGFSIPQNKSGYTEQGIRVISEVKLFEFSPVTFPANQGAAILGVKSLSDRLILDIKSITEQLMLAKAKGFHLEDSGELLKTMTELKALMNRDEPLINTQDDIKPLIDECKNSLQSLGDFAKTLQFK